MKFPARDSLNHLREAWKAAHSGSWSTVFCACSTGFTVERWHGIPLDSEVGARIGRDKFYIQHRDTSQLLGAKTVEQIARKMENSIHYLELNEITCVKYMLDI